MAKRIILILDKSGSMLSQADEVVEGVNDFIRDQKGAEIGAKAEDISLNLVMFSDRVEKMTNTTLKGADYLSSRDYRPGGSTALYDAIGGTVNKYKGEKSVILIVATDGMENSSQEYGHSDITRLLDECREKDGWNIIYLSEDVETADQGDTMGLKHSYRGCSNVNVGKHNIGKVYKSKSFQTAVKGMRTGCQTIKVGRMDLHDPIESEPYLLKKTVFIEQTYMKDPTWAKKLQKQNIFT